MSKKRGPKLSFNGYEKQHRVPFVIYVHFESWRQLQKGRSKYKKFLHNPCGFSYSIKCFFDEKLSKDDVYVGEDCGEVFWKTLKETAVDLSSKFENEVSPQSLSKKDKQLSSKVCAVCDKEIEEEVVEDFCPLSGKFLGVVHFQCHRVRKFSSAVPVIMHEFSKYGARFLLQSLTEKEIREIYFIENSSDDWKRKKETVYEKSYFYFSRKFGKISYKFIDSKNFLDETLEDLEGILGDDKKTRFCKSFREKKKCALMKKSFPFPFHHVDSFEKLEEKTLPNLAGFYGFLQYKNIEEDEYSRVEDIWKTLRCKKLADLFKLFLKSRVFLLEDIFENLRDLCLEKYKLDPAHYITIASVGWDAMLKKTNVELEILTDSVKINFLKSCIRGGIVQCSKRSAIANNKHCPNFDKQNPKSYIINLDANNLAGWAMSQKLPFSKFVFLTNKEISVLQKKLLDLTHEDDEGFILEVDLSYPKELHDLHNDLPFCSEKMLVPPNGRSKQLKPTLNFNDKKKYVIDYRYLLLCLKNGLILKKIHRVLRFHQTNWLKPYIDYNTDLRRNAQNDFEVKLYKLLNNAVYEKTIQKTSTNKPIYAGFCILELSKFFMYNFHYHVMRPKFENRISLLYTDTDSFFYQIETSVDIYKQMKNDKKIEKHLDLKNERTLGKLKDEYAGKIIREFCGVGAKVYCLDVEGTEIKKAVGVPKDVKQKFLSISDYQKCIHHDEIIKRAVFDTKVIDKQVMSCEMLKTVLSPGDDKRFVLSDKEKTLAWGHYSIC